jgi:glycosyltransferase involved in cell wall biosynthesis
MTTSLCLAMIVRNEAQVIARCLNSVKSLIDSWIIIDTGSTDATPSIIRHELKDIPGVLYDREWKNFGHNRTELLNLVQGTADYAMLLDADITVENLGFSRNQLTTDLYEVKVSDAYTYNMPYIVRTSLPWRYEGLTHEYITCDMPTNRDFLPTLVFHHHADGGTRPEKFQRDKRLLEESVRNNSGDTRAMFYLAQTRQNLGDKPGALAAFRKRIEMGGWDEEVFWSLYQVGHILSSQQDWPLAMQAYMSAWEYRPTRAEPLFRIAEGLRIRNHHHNALLWCDKAKTIPLPDDRLFVEKWIYDWGIDFERSVCLWWSGDVEASQEISRLLLTRDDLPDNYRTSVNHNLELSQSSPPPDQ